MSYKYGLESSDEEQSDDKTQLQIGRHIDEVIREVIDRSSILVKEFAKTAQKEWKRKVWTDEERQRLLEGVKIYGSTDIDRLREFVGTRTASEVLVFLHNLKDLPKHLPPKIDPTDVQPKVKRRRNGKQKSPSTIDRSDAIMTNGETQSTNEEPKENSETGHPPIPPFQQMPNALVRSANICPDAMLKEWQRVAGFVLKNRRDYSTETIKKVLTRKAVHEKWKAQQQGTKALNQTLDFNRIYQYLLAAIDNRYNRITLSDQEQKMVDYLIRDVASCGRNIPNAQEKKRYFDTILDAFHRNALVPQHSAQSPSNGLLSEDALCSLNPLCIPRDLLLEIPPRHPNFAEDAIYDGASETDHNDVEDDEPIDH